MSLTWATTVINKYRFELILILAELIVCLIVGLTLLKLFAPEIGRVLAAEPQLTRRRPIKLTTLPPLPTKPDPVEAVGIYISVTELQPPTAEPITLDFSQSSQPDSVADLTPLADWPVRGDISQAFGCSRFYTGIPGPDCPTTQPWFHDGLDIAAWLGAPVRAGLTGTVTFAGPDGDGPVCGPQRGPYRGYGLGVIVDTGSSWQTLYAHLNEINVSLGQQVTPDTLIGTVGETGCVTGPHLHLGLRQNGDLVDPQLYLKE